MALVNRSSNAGGGGGGGGVQSVTAGDTSIVIGGTATNPTVETADLATIAADHATSGDVALNSHKITGLAAGVAATDAARVGQLNAGTVTSVTAADTSIVIGGTAAAPTVSTATLDVISADHPPAAAVALNAQKITGLADGSAASDAAAFGQIPTALPPNGSAGGDLAGTYPNPTIAAAALTVDFATRSTDLTVTGTSAGTATTWITGNAVTYDGSTRIKIEAGCPEVAINTAIAECLVNVFDGATNLGVIATVGQAVGSVLSCYGAVYVTPTAGSHTYTVKAWKTAAGAAVTLRGASPYVASWYRITRA